MNKPITRYEPVRFGVIGLAATLIHTVSAYAMTWTTGLDQIWVNTIAFLIAFVISGVGHCFYTFKIEAGRSLAIAKWLIVSITGVALGNLIIWLAMEKLGLGRNIAQAGGILIVPLWSYLLGKFWAFRTHEA